MKGEQGSESLSQSVWASLLQGGDASSCLPANIYRAAFSWRQFLAQIQPSEAILSRVIFIWT